MVRVSFLQGVKRAVFFHAIETMQPAGAVAKVFFIISVSRYTQPDLHTAPGLFPAELQYFLDILSRHAGKKRRFVRICIANTSFEYVPHFLFIHFILLADGTDFVFSCHLRCFHRASLIMISFTTV